MKTEFKFPDCATCVNRQHDPFQCALCVKGSKFEQEEEDEDVEETLTYGEFQELLQG